MISSSDSFDGEEDGYPLSSITAVEAESNSFSQEDLGITSDLVFKAIRTIDNTASVSHNLKHFSSSLNLNFKACHFKHLGHFVHWNKNGFEINQGFKLSFTLLGLTCLIFFT